MPPPQIAMLLRALVDQRLAQTLEVGGDVVDRGPRLRTDFDVLSVISSFTSPNSPSYFRRLSGSVSRRASGRSRAAEGCSSSSTPSVSASLFVIPASTFAHAIPSLALSRRPFARANKAKAAPVPVLNIHQRAATERQRQRRAADFRIETGQFVNHEDNRRREGCMPTPTRMQRRATKRPRRPPERRHRRDVPATTRDRARPKRLRPASQGPCQEQRRRRRRRRMIASNRWPSSARWLKDFLRSVAKSEHGAHQDSQRREDRHPPSVRATPTTNAGAGDHDS